MSHVQRSTVNAHQYVWSVALLDWTPAVGSGVGLLGVAYDYVSLAQAATTDTYTFKAGGSGGTSVATVVITYTDATKAVISTVVKT